MLSDIWHQIVIGSYSPGKELCEHTKLVIKTQSSLLAFTAAHTVSHCRMPSPWAAQPEAETVSLWAQLTGPFCAHSCRLPTLIPVSQHCTIPSLAASDIYLRTTLVWSFLHSKLFLNFTGFPLSCEAFTYKILFTYCLRLSITLAEEFASLGLCSWDQAASPWEVLSLDLV